MAYKTFKSTQEVEAVDIQTMAAMSDSQYNEYLGGGLVFVDHHDVLRSQPAGYPLAVTKSQFKALLSHLKSLESRVGAE
ncbi:hypothetical protein FHR49_000559 [Xanthomonas campestris]